MTSTHYILAAAILSPAAALASPICLTQTASGTPVTLADIAAIPGSGVTDLGDGVYSMASSLEISAEAPLSIQGVKTLMMGDGVRLDINGPALFDATDGGAQPDARVTVTRADDTARPCGIRMCNETGAQSTFRNIDFEYAQLANAGATGFDVTDCTFTLAAGALNSTAAVAVASNDAVFRITGCTFSQCEVPAIGCPANHAVSLYISDCTFIDNNTANTNKPQLNLTVGGDHDLVIRDCTLTGTGRNMVGGIAVGNLTVLPGTNKVYIQGCTITGHRYGITGVGPMYMEIRDNTLIDNCHETNAMNGGSGISLAGYGYGLDAIVSGNHIERSLWGVTLIQCRDVNLGQVGNPDSPGGNTFKDNGNGGMRYDLYNNQAADVYAQLNTWSVAEQTAEEIEQVIFHNADNGSLGQVIFMPAASQTLITDASGDGAISLDGSVITAHRPVTILSADGRRVGATACRIDISALAPGVYIATDGVNALKIRR